MYGPEIKRFFIEGAVKEVAHLDRKQFDEEARLKSRMLKEGYTPVLDITPLVGVEYDREKTTYRYAITMYGVKVADPWVADGWLNGRIIDAPTKTMFNRIVRRTQNDGIESKEDARFL